MAPSSVAYRFCPCCGGSLSSRSLKAGEPDRLVCGACGFVFYLNPKVAACAICAVGGRVVLLRRSIEPQYGKWVFPGGFVDRGETMTAAAARETREEVGLDVEIGALVGVYSYPGNEVVVVVYEATVVGGKPAIGDECLEVRAFEPEAIPWDDLAFDSTREALRAYVQRLLGAPVPAAARNANRVG
jgi:ADP-ribose pyrophosphatase YjhB (NUDIX family)